MKVALFGGRFDPVHNGHLAIAKEVLSHEDIDELWFIPDNIHQWNPIVASADDRLKMLELAIGNRHSERSVSASVGMTNKKNIFRISDIAIRHGGQTNTIDIINVLKASPPGRWPNGLLPGGRGCTPDFIFICGSDQILNFHKWTKWDELEKNLDFLIIPRKGFSITSLPSNCKILSDKTYEPLDDASTTIRERLKKGQSITGLVPEKVEEYIIEKGLYK